MNYVPSFTQARFPTVLQVVLGCLLASAAVVVYLAPWVSPPLVTFSPEARAVADSRQVRLFVHPERIDFHRLETQGVVGETKERLADIPFDQPGAASLVVSLPAESLTNPKGEVADEVHIFNPPSGLNASHTTRKFLFHKNTLIEQTMGIDSGELARVIREMNSL